jgi:hypothetical protein
MANCPVNSGSFIAAGLALSTIEKYIIQTRFILCAKKNGTLALEPWIFDKNKSLIAVKKGCGAIAKGFTFIRWHNAVTVEQRSLQYPLR